MNQADREITWENVTNCRMCYVCHESRCVNGRCNFNPEVANSNSKLVCMCANESRAECDPPTIAELLLGYARY